MGRILTLSQIIAEDNAYYGAAPPSEELFGEQMQPIAQLQETIPPQWHPQQQQPAYQPAPMAMTPAVAGLPPMPIPQQAFGPMIDPAADAQVNQVPVQFQSPPSPWMPQVTANATIPQDVYRQQLERGQISDTLANPDAYNQFYANPQLPTDTGTFYNTARTRGMEAATRLGFTNNDPGEMIRYQGNRALVESQRLAQEGRTPTYVPMPRSSVPAGWISEQQQFQQQFYSDPQNWSQPLPYEATGVLEFGHPDMVLVRNDVAHNGYRAQNWQDQATQEIARRAQAGVPMTQAGQAPAGGQGYPELGGGQEALTQAYQQRYGGAQRPLEAVDMAPAIAQSVADNNTFLQNASGAWAENWNRLATGLVGTVAPQTARGMQQDAAMTYGPVQPGSGGSIAGNTAAVLTQFGAGGATVAPAVFGASGFGNTRVEAADRRIKGQQISKAQEFAGALLTGAIQYAGARVRIGNIMGAGERIAARYLPAITDAILRGDKAGVTRILGEITNGFGVNAGLAGATTILDNAVRRSTIAPEQGGLDNVLPSMLEGGVVGAVGAAVHASFAAFRDAPTWAAREEAVKNAAANMEPGQYETAMRDLGLDPRRTYTPDQLQAAFRSRVRKAHPDAGGTQADFERVTKAWATIKPQGEPAQRPADQYDTGSATETSDSRVQQQKGGSNGQEERQGRQEVLSTPPQTNEPPANVTVASSPAAEQTTLPPTETIQPTPKAQAAPQTAAQPVTQAPTRQPPAAAPASNVHPDDAKLLETNNLDFNPSWSIQQGMDDARTRGWDLTAWKRNYAKTAAALGDDVAAHLWNVADQRASEQAKIEAAKPKHLQVTVNNGSGYDMEAAQPILDAGITQPMIDQAIRGVSDGQVVSITGTKGQRLSLVKGTDDAGRPMIQSLYLPPELHAKYPRLVQGAVTTPTPAPRPDSTRQLDVQPRPPLGERGQRAIGPVQASRVPAPRIEPKPQQSDSSLATSPPADQPILTRASRHNDIIQLSFDGTARVPEPAELQERIRALGFRASVVKFATNIISGTQGNVAYRIDVERTDKLGSHEAAKQLYQAMFGHDRDINNPSAFEQRAPMGQRLEAARQAGIASVIGKPAKTANTADDDLPAPEVKPDESKIVNPIDTKASPEEKVRQLEELSKQNAPLVEQIIKQIDSELGTSSKFSFKLPDRILSKSRRPSILAEKPWFDVEHVRDGLRFKTVLRTLEDVPKILEIVQRHGVEVVKLDTKKMLHPKEWGWRFVALDLRMPNGQLVEHYMPLLELEKAKKDGNHQLFEKWRNKTPEEWAANKDEYLDDLSTSYNRYQEAWIAALGRLGLSESAAEASWNSISARLESMTRSKLSLSSSGPNTPTSQTPPILTSGLDSSLASTITRPEDVSSDTTISTPATGNIDQTQGEGNYNSSGGLSQDSGTIPPDGNPDQSGRDRNAGGGITGNDSAGDRSGSVEVRGTDQSPPDGGSSGLSTGQPGEPGGGDGGTSDTGTGELPPSPDNETGPLASGAGGSGTGGRGRGGAGESAGPGRSDAPVDQSNLPPEKRDLVLTPNEAVAPSTDTQKFRANIAALKLLQELEKANRDATPEEKQILSRYTGWGWAKEVFNDNNPRWEKQRKELKPLLSEEEWKSARGSTLNAHYTDPRVITPMWDLVRKLGFKGGRMVEPAGGTGLFVGLMPQDLKANSKITMVELDQLTARLAKKMYPQVDVRNEGFEVAKIPNNSVRLFISNFPFGDYATGGSDYPKLLIHDYFFARAMDKTEPGGLIVAITSNGTMDKLSPKVRQLLAANTDLVGAIRLPNKAFAENAGTEVTTDIIVLRKKDLSDFTGQPWTNVVQVGEAKVTNRESGETEIKPIKVNEYYAAHPEMALGKHSLEGTMYRIDSYALVPTRGANLGEQLQAAIEKFPADIMGTQGVTLTGEVKEAAQGDKSLQYVERDGRVWQVIEGELKEPDWLTKKWYGDDPEAAIKPEVAVKRRQIASDWIKLRNVVRELFKAEMKPDVSEGELKVKRAALNRQYDSYVKEYGTVRRGPKQTHFEKARFMEDDPDYALVQSIEQEIEGISPKTGDVTYTYVKGPVFSKRVNAPKTAPAKVGTVDEAISVSLGYRNAIDPKYVAKLLGVSEKQAIEQIKQSGRAFEDPATGLMTTREKYLSGNVREKLRVAEEAAKTNELYKPNVEALKSVQPKDVEIGDIFMQLGSRWIPDSVYSEFATELFGAKTRIKQLPEANTYVISARSNGPSFVSWSTSRVGAYEILKHALLGTEPRVMDKTQDDRTVVNETATREALNLVKRMRDEFTSWYKTTPARITDAKGVESGVQELLAREYNRLNNSVVAPEYDGKYLALPGLSPEVFRLPHRLSMVARGLQERFGLMAHGVGSGKTFTQIVLAMELRRLGLAKKPMIVVQKATIGQFAASFLQAYPNAKIVVANEKNFSAKARKRLMAQIAMGDWDAVIVTQPQFDRLELTPKEVESYFNEQLQELEDAISEAVRTDGAKASSTKDLERALKSLRARQKQLVDRATEMADKAIPFDELGVDTLLIDEAHAYKRAVIVTRKKRVKGIPTQASSRAVTAMIKIRSVQAKNQGKGIFPATGTPITNSIAEAYVMMEMTAPHILREYGISNFDAFANTFGDVVSQPEYTWAGKWQMVSRFNTFVNGPELITMIRSVFDVKMGNKELGLKVPEIAGGKPEIIVTPQTPGQEQVSEWLDRVGTAFEQTGDKREVSWVPIMTMQVGMASALDPRLVDPSLPDDPGSKVNTAVKNILDIWKKGKKDKTTQLVFADRFKPMDISKLTGFESKGDMGAVEVELNDLGEDDDAPLKEEDDVDESVLRLDQEDADFKADGFNLYKDIKAKLVKAGIPAEEIAIIHEASTDARRTALFAAMNAGKIRILLGSTEKMGVGVNIQKRLVAAHHLDPPRMMTPAMMEQRNGRIIRQGNDNKVVRILNYGTENTMDIAIYQMLESKQKGVVQALSGKASGRQWADPADEVIMSMREQKAALTGDPRVLRQIELQSKVREMDADRRAFESGQANRRQNLDYKRRSIKMDEEKYLPEAKARLAKAKAELSDFTSGQVGETKYSDKAEYLKAIEKAFEKLTATAKEQNALATGQVWFNGLPIQLAAAPSEARHYKLQLGGREYQSDVKGALGMMASIRSIPKTLEGAVESTLQGIARERAEIPVIEKDLKQEFGQTKELEAAKRDLEALQADLMKNPVRRKASKQPMPQSLPARLPAAKFVPGTPYHYRNRTLMTADQMDTAAWRKGIDDDPADDLRDLTRESPEAGDLTDLGAPARPSKPRIDIDPLPNGDVKQLKDIVLDVSRDLKKQIRQQNHRGNILGMYQPQSTRLTVRYSGDLESTAHEIGHKLDDDYGIVAPWARSASSPFDAELIPNFSYYGARGGSLARRRAEGVAEWIRAYLVNPAAAMNAAPLFYAHFVQQVPKDVLTQLREFGDQIRQWAGLSPVDRALTNIDVHGVSRKLTEQLRDAVYGKPTTFTSRTWWDKLVSAVQDDLHPVMKAIYAAKGLREDLGPLLPIKDPEMLIRLHGGFNAKMEAVLEHGIFSRNGKRMTAGGFTHILEPLDSSTKETLAKDVEDLLAMMTNERVLEKAQQVDDKVEARIADWLTLAGLPPTATIADIFRVDKKLAMRVMKLRAAGRERMGRLSGQGGGITPDYLQAGDVLKQIWKDPVRYARLSEAAKRYRDWGNAMLVYALRSHRYSAQQIRAWRAANKFYVAFHRVIDDLDLNVPRRGLARADQPIQSFKGSTRQMENPLISLMVMTERVLRESDRNWALKGLRDLLTTDRRMYQGDPRDLDAIGSRNLNPNKKTDIPIWVNGKPEYWQFEDGVNQSLNAWGQVDDGHFLSDILKIPGRTTRWMVTHSPAFIVRNLIRDTFTRSLISEHGGNPLDILKGSNQAQLDKIKMAGGAHFGLIHRDRFAWHKEMKSHLDDMVKDKNIVLMLPKMGLKSLAAVFGENELWGRNAEYRRAYAHARNKLGYDDGNATLYAAFHARGLLDFAIAGHLMRKFNSMFAVPFVNARIQGSTRFAKAVKDNPLRMAWRIGLLTMAIAAVQAWKKMTGTDDEYDQLNYFRRDNFLNFKIGNVWMAIPLPQEASLITAAIDRAIDAARGRAHAFEGYSRSVINNLNVFGATDLMGPANIAMQSMANRDLFFDRSIVPEWEKDKNLALRDTSRASRIGQAVQWMTQKMGMGIDARNVDFVVRSLGGGVGNIVTNISDVGRDDKPAGRHLTSTGLLYMNPGQGSRDVQWVQDKVRELGMENTKLLEPLKLLIKDQQRSQSLEEWDRLAKEVQQEAVRVRKILEENESAYFETAKVKADARRERRSPTYAPQP